MKHLPWIILTFLVIFCALAIGTGLMTAGDIFNHAVNTANTAAELTANVIK